MTDAINDKKYLTPQDRTSLANSIFDTLCDLRMYPSSNTSKDILDLASSDEKAELVLKRLLQALLPTKEDNTAGSWKELSLVLIHQQEELKDLLGILYSTVRLVEKEDPSNDKRLEILFHLVAAVQQKRLLQLGQNEETPPQAELDPATDESSLPITLPSHFSSQQRALVASCYQHLSEDYECRLQGLYQRLHILQANLGANATDSHPSLTVTSMDTAELQNTLSQPVSISSAKRQQSKTTPLRDVHIQDRGGRVDTADARNPVMPEWTTERQEPTSGRGGRGGRGGGRGGRGGRGRGGGKRNSHNNRTKRQN